MQNIARSADDRAFVQTLIDLARRLQIKTVAEWVQDEHAASMLRDWGCDYIQGRLIGLASSERPWNRPVDSGRRQVRKASAEIYYSTSGATKNYVFLRLFRHALETVLHLLHLPAKVVDVVVVRHRLFALFRLGRALPARGGTNGLNIENVC